MPAKINLDIKFSKNSRINEVAKKHLQIICSRVLDTMSETTCSLILTGAATQCEGSAISSKNKVKILSDYDILVVVKNGDDTTLRKKLRQLSIDLTKELRVQGLLSCVALHPTTKAGLTSLIPTIANLNLKDSGAILYGEDVSNLIPSINPKEIPKWDALKILFNRACEQLLYLHPNLFYNDSIPENLLELNIYQTTKTFLDICTSLLAFHGMLVPTYIKRINEFKRLLDRSAFLNELIPSSTLFQEWLDFKMSPDLRNLPKTISDSNKTLREQCLSAWLDASELFFPVLSYEVNSLLGRNIADHSFELKSIVGLTEIMRKNAKLVFNVYKSEILRYVTTHKRSCFKHPVKTMNIIISQISPRAFMYLSLLLVYFSTKYIVKREIGDKLLLDYSRKYMLSIPHMKIPFIQKTENAWNMLRIKGLKLWADFLDEPFFENSENNLYLNFL